MSALRALQIDAQLQANWLYKIYVLIIPKNIPLHKKNNAIDQNFCVFYL